MTKTSSFLFRLSGILFFVAVVSTALIVLEQNISSFIFFIASESTAWGLYFVFSSAVLVSAFLFALFSSGTAAIFAGTGGYVQSVWNTGMYALFCTGLYSTSQLVTGITHDDAKGLMYSGSSLIFFLSLIFICVLLVYNLFLFILLKKEEGFYVKNLLSLDSNTKLCLKVYGVMLGLIEAGCFLYAHKFI